MPHISSQHDISRTPVVQSTNKNLRMFESFIRQMNSQTLFGSVPTVPPERDV